MQTKNRKEIAKLLMDGEVAFKAANDLRYQTRIARAQGMIAAVKAGWTLREIADELGLSFPRVQQLIRQELDRQNTAAAMSDLED